MQPAFVLVHSPAVGPLTWAAVADSLAVRRRESVIPSLLDVADVEPPFWPRVVDVVNAAMSRLDQGQAVVLVAHSNAGLFVPLLVMHAVRPVRCCLFVDAALPARAGQTPAAPAELLHFLRGKVTDGRLPPWTEWWDEDISVLFPVAATRAAVAAEQPRLPLAYYEQSLPVPAGWDDEVSCGYLLFSPPYDEVAADARSRGWLVEELTGQHLHQLVDPDAAADRLITMADSLAEGDT
jgi:hypothetical protein